MPASLREDRFSSFQISSKSQVGFQPIQSRVITVEKMARCTAKEAEFPVHPKIKSVTGPLTYVSESRSRVL